jgi:cyanophycin synthetase
MNTILEPKESKLLPSARLLLKEFSARNIDIIAIEPDSNSFFAKINNNYIYCKGIKTPLNTLSAVTLCDDKLMSKKALSLFNIPTPEYLCYSRKQLPILEQILPEIDSFIKKHKRIIAKPQNGMKSKDVFLDITTIEQAKAAFKSILEKKYRGILFEKYIPGEVHRLLFVKGKLIAALKKEKGYILGNGQSTIVELIEEKNKYLDQGNRAVGRIVIDDKLTDSFAAQNLKLSDIPKINTKIFTENDFSNLETVSEVTELVNKDLANKLGNFAVSFGLGLTGIDVITNDISNEDVCSVIEINKEPGIDFHHYPDYGSSINVAKEIVDAIITQHS